MAKIVEVGKWNKVPLPGRFMPKEPWQGLEGRLRKATMVLCSKTRSLQEKLSQDKFHRISLHQKKPDNWRKRLDDGLTSESNCERFSLYIYTRHEFFAIFKFQYLGVLGELEGRGSAKVSLRISKVRLLPYFVLNKVD